MQYEYQEYAKELGATKVKLEYVRKERDRDTGLYPSTPPWLFAVRYFNDQNHEIGYYLPDTLRWSNCLNEFVPPRQWHCEFLHELVDGGQI